MDTLEENNNKANEEIARKAAEAAERPAGVLCSCGAEMMETDGLRYVENTYCFYRVKCPACGLTGEKMDA